MSDTNHAALDAAFKIASTLGTNFKTLRDNKRKLAYSLVVSSVVEGFALQETITDAKSKMKWTKLDASEQNQMNVLFTAVRVIDGAWKGLDEATRKAFVAGEIIFSTLAKAIKDAEKARLEAEAKAEAEAEKADSERDAPADPKTGKPVSDPLVDAMRAVALFVDETPIASMTPDQLLALHNLADAIDEMRKAAQAQIEEQAQAQAA